MNSAPACADDILHLAIETVRKAGPEISTGLDDLPAAIYTTDAQGRLTYFNRACIEFAGRTPRVGEDRWCVTWRLYNEDGSFLPHDECPMALAIRERRPVRGIEAIAERPDGTRRRFRPHPTPLFGEGGRFEGAINLLLDVSGRERAEHLREQARRCRRLARAIDDQRTIDSLNTLAGEYEQQAAAAQPLS